MKKLINSLFSISTAGFLLLLFALALAIATFVENSYGSEAARAIVYNSWWLELILLILAINLVANIFRYKLYKKQKLTMGIFHLSFILILLGAGVTRYFGSEGVMHIREGEASSMIVTQEPWFHFNVEYEGEKKGIAKKFMTSSVSKNQISESLKIGSRQISIKSVDYIPQAQKSIEPSKTGNPFIELVYPIGTTMQTEFLQDGQVIQANGVTFGFNAEAEVRFTYSSDTLRISSKETVSMIDMGGKDSRTFEPDKAFTCIEKKIYKVRNAAFVIKQFLPSATLTAVQGNGNQSGEDAVKIRLSDNQKQEVVTVWNNSEGQGPRFEGLFEGIKVSMWIGPKETILPFSIALNDFVLERYPGSNSPSSYESMVTLTDKEEGINKISKIFMNNVLKHRGYRFYQSSYDQDEKGTILSVNKDPWGTLITYVGYFLLILGIILSIFNPRSYFFKLMKNVSAGTSTFVLLFVLGSFNVVTAQPTEIKSDIASEFSKVWVQGHDGRIKPFSTLAYEVVMKVSRSEKLFGQNPEHIVLGMAANPIEWQRVAMIAVSDAQTGEKLGIKGDKAAFTDFFDTQGNYKLAHEIQTAYGKSPAERGKFDNSVIKIDERLNVVYQLYNGDLFRFYPSRDSKDGNWYSQDSKLPSAVNADSMFIRTSFKNFLEALKSNKSGEAGIILSFINDYQQKYGSMLIPGKTKGKLEIFYNHVNIFKDLSALYILLGFILVAFFFHSLFTGKSLRKVAVRITITGLFIGFVAHSLGLIVRGYISGHMPWSNGYESMVYIAWAGM